MTVASTATPPDAQRSDLRATARAFLDNRSGSAEVRAAVQRSAGYDSTLWETLVELGWVGMLAPVELGGGGAGFGDVAVILEELGHHLTPGPFLGTAVLATSALLLAGSDQQRARWLPELAVGRLRGTLATCGRTGSPQSDQLGVTATDAPHGVLLNGVAAYVPDAANADLLVVAARHGEGVTLAVVDRRAQGLTVVHTPTIDETRRLSEVRCDDVVVGRDRVLGSARGQEHVLWMLLERAAVAVAADSLGGSARVLALSVDYARRRHQFGRPIGSFQAIKHMCADMHVLVQASRAAVEAAAEAVESREDKMVSGTSAAIAKLHAAEAYARIAGDSVQLHGGVGYTCEHDAHLHLKRAKLNQSLFGGARWQRERIARLTLAARTADGPGR